MNKDITHYSARLLLFIALIMTIQSAFGLELPQNVKQCLQQATITEDNMLNGPNESRDVLMGYMRNNWRPVLSQFDSVAPSDVQKSVLIRAAESLDANDYLSFLTTIRDLRAAGRISPKVFENALLPSRYKEGFLAVNDQNPEVRKFVESLRPMVAQNSNLRTYPDDILSGKSKVRLLNRLSAERMQVDQKLILPQVPSVSVATASVSPTSAVAEPNRSAASVVSSTPQLSPAKTERPTPEEEAITKPAWLYALAVIILGGIGFVFYRNRRR